MKYYTKRQFDSNIHGYEFNPTECDSAIEFGKPGQYETLSSIKNQSKLSQGFQELAKINLGFFGTTEHHGSMFTPSTVNGSAEGKGVECYLTKDGQFVVGNITDKQISNLKGDVQWGCSLSYALLINGKKGFTGSSLYSHFGQRNPRTLIGQKADKTMVLAVVEGRNSTSKGVTGDQSADIMLSLGCINAINADGGGSSEIILDGKIVNQLADGAERKIGSALVVYEKEVKSVDINTFGVDGGHAGFGVTAGKRTTDGTMYEWDFNNAVAVLVEQKLLTYENVKVVRLDDRTGKKDIPLADRVAKALKEKVVAVVSIHANADGRGDVWTDANGIETFISDDRFPFNELELASCIQNHLIRETGRKNRGVKRGNLFMTKVSDMIPSVLVECGFMTNKEEAALLKSASYRDKCATAIVYGLVEQFKLVPKVKGEIEQPQKDGERALNLTGSQFQMLAKVYENAHKKGILSSDQWHKKASEKKLTVDEATFLNGVILGHLIK
jgi:N-acetylmuramoyl-L-alanine amidase